MRIYRNEHGEFYFAQGKESGWFSASWECNGDYNTMRLNNCIIFHGIDEAWDKGIEVPNDKYTHFNEFMRHENNYGDLCAFIKEFYDVTQEELDEEFDHHPHLFELTEEILREYGEIKDIRNWVFDRLYDEVKRKYQLWNGDVNRIKAWLKNCSFINSVMYPDHTMVDIFGEMSQVRRSLIRHFFHDHVLTDEILDEAEKLHPEMVDYDKAYNFVKTKVQEAYDKERLQLAQGRHLDAKEG